jgi:hypothetical protein
MTSRRLEIPGSSPFEQTGWDLLVLKTPAQTMSTFIGAGDPPLIFGYKGEVDASATIRALAAFDGVSDLERRIDDCIPLKTFEVFDYCGFVGGPNRRILRGICEDEDLVQVIPLFACELSEEGRMPPIDRFRRWTDILDMRRAPQPWFQFRMKGDRSGLCVEKWGMEQMSTFEGFIRILSDEPGAWLEVKNRLGSIFSLPNNDGWDQAVAKVRAHVGITGT